MCISNSGLSAKIKVCAFNKSHYQTESEVLFNPLLLIHKPLAVIRQIQEYYEL